MDQGDSWYALRPGIVHHDRPAVFEPKDVSPEAVHSFPGSQGDRKYTRSELSKFWDSILISAASRNALKKFSLKLIVFSNNNKNPDNNKPGEPSVSPGYFENWFMDTFGPVVFVLDYCGIYFFVFLLFKFILDVVTMIIRHLEITKMTGASLELGKTFLSASENIYLMSVF